MPLSRDEARHLAARSLLLQVLLNYRTMQGSGYLFALWPWLRRSESSSVRVKACADYLNAHPVFGALAIGAMRRRIEEGDVERDPTEFGKWQESLCGPLGMVGDSLIWDRWKPLLFSLGVLLLLWFPAIEVWAGVAIGCLLLYNVPLVRLRVWAVSEGYRLGGNVLEALGHPLVGRLRKGLSIAGACVAGLLLASGVLQSGSTAWSAAAQFAVAFALMLLAVSRRWGILWSLLLALGAALLVPAILLVLPTRV